MLLQAGVLVLSLADSVIYPGNRSSLGSHLRIVYTTTVIAWLTGCNCAGGSSNLDIPLDSLYIAETAVT